jgi:hypothetical protein
MESMHVTPRREPWNKGKLVGQKAPLKFKSFKNLRRRPVRKPGSTSARQRVELVDPLLPVGQCTAVIHRPPRTATPAIRVAMEFSGKRHRRTHGPSLPSISTRCFLNTGNSVTRAKVSKGRVYSKFRSPPAKPPSIRSGLSTHSKLSTCSLRIFYSTEPSKRALARFFSLSTKSFEKRTIWKPLLSLTNQICNSRPCDSLAGTLKKRA